jgi:D-alanyl-D-alanine carboxypeptidase/D-alanyl-D-alanine-endopeptidase (penicillin-binding protein 4)
MRSAIRLLLLILFTISQQGYLGSATGHTTKAPANVNPVKRLCKDLDRIISDARFAQAQIGIEVLSLDRTDILYEKNAQQLLTPASSNKIITAAVALMKLGAGYRFETRVWTNGQVENGVLKGNLLIEGSGDPTYSSKFNSGDPFANFRIWAANLKERNIRAISGSTLGNEGTFGEPALGQGWEWNDLSHAFAAPVSALQFNDNMVTLTIAPGAEQGNPALIRESPLEGYLKINNGVVTGQEKSRADIRIRNGESGETIDVWGTIPAKGVVIQQTAAIRYPALYFLSALRYILSNEGIAVENIALAGQVSNPSDLSPLWVHSSPELSEIIKPLLKNSLNLYAETLVRALGTTFRGEGSFAKGKEIVEETLEQMGIETGTYSYADGSGLSRLNLESADSFVRLLKFMHQDKTFHIFYDALPIAGVDGTLASRMKRTKAEDNVHAKTGSMANVSSISGYVKTIDGEMLAFSIGVNGYIGSRDAVESMQDKILTRLADFSRKKVVRSQ